MKKETRIIRSVEEIKKAESLISTFLDVGAGTDGYRRELAAVQNCLIWLMHEPKSPPYAIGGTDPDLCWNTHDSSSSQFKSLLSTLSERVNQAVRVIKRFKEESK